MVWLNRKKNILQCTLGHDLKHSGFVRITTHNLFGWSQASLQTKPCAEKWLHDKSVSILIDEWDVGICKLNSLLEHPVTMVISAGGQTLASCIFKAEHFDLSSVCFDLEKGLWSTSFDLQKGQYTTVQPLQKRWYTSARVQA